jgi:hypothetical protein
MLKTLRLCVFLSVVTLALLQPNVAWAHGALAVGVPESIVKDGIAVGFAWNAPDGDIAQVESLKSCLNLKTASAKARVLCKVVSTFRHSCFSVALDQPGGSGWGWAVERSVLQAEGKALRACNSTVQKICSIAFTQCDDTP